MGGAVVAVGRGGAPFGIVLATMYAKFSDAGTASVRRLRHRPIDIGAIAAIVRAGTAARIGDALRGGDGGPDGLAVRRLKARKSAALRGGATAR